MSAAACATVRRGIMYNTMIFVVGVWRREGSGRLKTMESSHDVLATPVPVLHLVDINFGVLSPLLGLA
jgi:hypothetical protein